jgi:hypothetical protein
MPIFDERPDEIAARFGERLRRETAAGTAYEAAFKRPLSAAQVEALDAIADAARDQMAREAGAAAERARIRQMALDEADQLTIRGGSEVLRDFAALLEDR